jgi:hypothetical protein
VPSAALTAVVSPDVTIPGSAVTLTASLTNNGLPALTQAALATRLPAGWTAAATSAATFTNIGSGQSVQASWRVTVPGGADPQTAAAGVQSTYTTGAQRGVTNASADVFLPYPSLAAAGGDAAAKRREPAHRPAPGDAHLRARRGMRPGAAQGAYQAVIRRSSVTTAVTSSAGVTSNA